MNDQKVAAIPRGLAMCRPVAPLVDKKLVKGDWVFEGIIMVLAASVLLILLIMILEMVQQSLPAIQKFGWRFTIGREWDHYTSPSSPPLQKRSCRRFPSPRKRRPMPWGATRWEMVRVALIPYARSGVLGAVILGLGRAIGETMAVTMVIGNTPQISLSLLAPGYTMPSVIANEFAETTSKLHASALMEVGLILLVVTIIINALARLLIWSVTRGDTGARA